MGAATAALLCRSVLRPRRSAVIQDPPLVLAADGDGD